MTRKEAVTQYNKRGCLWRLFRVFVYFILFCVSWVLLSLYIYKDHCVRLTNGYMIGHPAIFHQNDSHFEMVLRGPNGRVITRTDGFIDLRRHPTNPDLVIFEYPSPYGRKQITMPGEGMMDLIFPEKEHGQKWNEKNKNYPNSTQILGTGLAHILFTLKNDKRYGSANCGTPWFDF